MKLFNAAMLAYLLLAVPAAAQPTPPPAVLLPEKAATVTPATDTVKLEAGRVYVFRSEKACVVVTSPQGIVKITKPMETLAGPQFIAGDGSYGVKADAKIVSPLEMRAKFFEGDGTLQTKVFAEKYVWCVEALASGTTELLIIPPGAGEKDIIRRTIEALNGPQPPPPPPVPVDDPLAVILQAALDKETPADKKLLPKLAAMYRQSVATVNDPATKTAGELLTTMHGAAQTLIGASLPNVRQALSVELKSLLPTMPNAPMDATIRATAAAEFTRIAGILSSLKYPH